MTSKAQTIGTMVGVVAEGRCALVATHQIFQFIIGYAAVQVRAYNFSVTCVNAWWHFGGQYRCPTQRYSGAWQTAAACTCATVL